MPSVDQRRAFNLVDYIDTILAPLIDRPMGDSANAQAIRQAGLLESFLWLDLGVRSGFFPLGEAQQVLTYYYYPLLSSAHQFLERYGYLFPTHLQDRIKKAANQKTLERAGETTFSGLTLFQTGVAQSARVLLNDCHSYLLVALLFGPDDAWSKFSISSEISAEDIQLLVDGEGGAGDAPEPLLVAGMLIQLQRVAVVLALGAASNTPDLLRSIVQISKWSLNFDIKQVEERFTRLTSAFEEALQRSREIRIGFEQAKLIRGTYRKGSFKDGAEALLRDWYNRGLLMQTVGSGKGA